MNILRSQVCRLVVLALLAAACSSTATETAQGRDDVITQWGHAMLSSDFEAMAELLEPSAREEWTSSPSFQQLLDIPQPEVELNDLSFRIESETDNTVDVVYLGERCAQEATNTFTPTTTVTSDGTSAGDGETASEGTVTFGEVTCVNLADFDVAPSRFVLVDDTWHATLGQ